jgi:nucleoside-triphosphatase
VSTTLLRGRPGVGKTTVAARVAARVAEWGVPAHGFVTEERRQGRRRHGFAVRRLEDGVIATLADVDLPGPPRVGRYGVDLAAFERIALPAVDVPSGGVVIIDELGPMELADEAFGAAVERLVERGDVAVLATVHTRPHPVTDRLVARDDVGVVEVTVDNRDGLPESLADRLLGDRPRGR